MYPAELHTDRGGEFLSGDLLDFYEELGIKATQAPAYTPQHNVHAERMDRTLVAMARTMMIAAAAPKQLWGEAICHAAVLHNRLKVHADGSTPLQRLTGKRIVTDLHALHPWGCTAYVATPLQLQKDKYDPTGVKVVFVGIEDPTGYRLLPIEGADKVFISRNVKFQDHDFSAMASYRESLQEAGRERKPRIGSIASSPSSATSCAEPRSSACRKSRRERKSQRVQRHLHHRRHLSESLLLARAQ